MKTTEKEALMSYIETFGEAIPAKLHGKIWNEHFFGSEVTRRARDLRAEGRLISEKEGKFEKFMIPQRNRIPEGQLFAVDQYQIQ